MITQPGQEITWGEMLVGNRSMFAAAGFDRGEPSDAEAGRDAHRLPTQHTKELHMAEQSAPIILVPGFWLGAWAWDEVADTLRADGHDVTALTLPGHGVEGRGPIRDHVRGPRRRDRRRGRGG